MAGWTVGRATITPGHRDRDRSPRRSSCSRASTRPACWTSPIATRGSPATFVDDDGYLLQRIQCLVVDVDGVRIAVDTCVGNDKERANPGWAHQQLPFLDDMTAAGFAAGLDRRRRVHPPARRPRRLEHDARRRAMGADVPQRPLRLRRAGVRVLAGHDDGRRRRVRRLGRPDRRCRPGRPGARSTTASTGRSASTRPPGHTPGHVSVVIESGGRARGDHRRHDPHAAADRRGRPVVGLRLRPGRRSRHPPVVPRALRRRHAGDRHALGRDRVPGASAATTATGGASDPAG